METYIGKFPNLEIMLYELGNNVIMLVDETLMTSWVNSAEGKYENCTPGSNDKSKYGK